MNIQLTIKNYRCFTDSHPCQIMLQKGFTALLGANNSGKSSLLKFFYEFRPLFAKLHTEPTVARNAFRGSKQPLDIQPSIFEREELHSKSNDRDLTIDIHLPEVAGWADQNSLRWADRIRITVERRSGLWNTDLFVADNRIKPSGDLAVDATTLQRGGEPLASLSALSDALGIISDTLYIGAFRNVINVGANKAYYDIQVGQAFVERWRTIKTGRVARENEAADTITEDICRILGLRKLEINPSDDGTTLQLLINGKSRKLPEVGAGMAQLILVLINAATQQKSLILIDEPELNLHPALQLDFLTTLGLYCNQGVVFSTHSIGLARAAAERIYMFRSPDDGVSEVQPYEATPELSEVLGELSFSGYRELGAETVLLVEGATDVRTMHQFLRLYKKDHTVVVIPLGGSQLIGSKTAHELQEFMRLSGRVHAIIDSERSSQDVPLCEEREGFRRNCETAGIKCHVLERRAIENYFPGRAIKEVKGTKYNALGPYDLLSGSSPA